MRCLLPIGLMTSRDRPVRLADVNRPALMTIEGERDDVTGAGQCRVALDICTRVPGSHKQHHGCLGVGHYGIFNGTRFKAEIVPRILTFMRAHDSSGSPSEQRVGPSSPKPLGVVDPPFVGDDAEGSYNFYKRRTKAMLQRTECSASITMVDAMHPAVGTHQPTESFLSLFRQRR
jgi:hypothetical protein